ncbi:MAG: hypothetical protein ACE5G2_09870 [Candidatus Krumholzibacteriia bacterium]
MLDPSWHRTPGDRHGRLPRLAKGLLLVAGLLVVPGCPEKSPVQVGNEPDTGPVLESEEALVAALEDAYRQQSFTLFARLLADADGGYVFAMRFQLRSGVSEWGRDKELLIHHRMLEPQRLAPDEPPVPAQLLIESIDVSFSPREPFSERTDLYYDPVKNPAGLDPERWRVTQASYTVRGGIRMQNLWGYRMQSPSRFVVIDDLSRMIGERGKYRLYRWEDQSYPNLKSDGSAEPGAADAVPSWSWAQIKELYLPEPGIDSETAFIREFEHAYGHMSHGSFAAFLSGRDGAEFRFETHAAVSAGPASWGRTEELEIHERMFNPRFWQAGELPVPQDLRMESIRIHLTPLTEFSERPELYHHDATNPSGLDPGRWRASRATYWSYAYLATKGPDYQVSGPVRFTVLEDRARSVGEAGKFTLHHWEELDLESAEAPHTPMLQSGVREVTWATVKGFYRPRRVESEADLMRIFADTYRRQDYLALSSLLSGVSSARYVFVLAEPDPRTGETGWDLDEELALHLRMFKPEISTGGPPLPWQLRVTAIALRMVPESDFVERPDLYFHPESNPDGLDPERWRATEATYRTSVFFDTLGEPDYQVEGRASFVVIDEGARSVGDPLKYHIYVWEDLGSAGTSLADPSVFGSMRGRGGTSMTRAAGPPQATAAAITWGEVKSLYR